MTYNDDRLGIIIQYPSNWKRIVDLDGLITFIAPWEAILPHIQRDLD
jgi:hypothetical protein